MGSVQVDLRGPAGLLEALYEEPSEARFAAAVCHPHPLHGGAMRNRATYRIARAVRAAGGASLRFNFRGVGRSQGGYGAGEGEAADARAALDWLAETRPGLPRYACGFSFGAWIALRVGCGDRHVRGILAAGLAPHSFSLDFVRHCPKPVAAVQAAHDEFASPEEAGRLLAGASAPRRLWVVAAATHLFTEDLEDLQRQAESGLSWLLEQT